MSTDSGAPASDTDAVYGALDRVDEAVCAVDTEWQFTFVNAEAGALLGRGPEELLETTIWDAVPHVGDGRVGGKLREAMRTQAPVRFESYSEERERWFRVRIYPSEDGLTAFFYDITDERGARSTDSGNGALRDRFRRHRGRAGRRRQRPVHHGFQSRCGPALWIRCGRCRRGIDSDSVH
ncbi:PAS domain-containing protein [Halomicroarcula sp. GCM10025894]|uniref:PAS domain-containing protein n=1 Tax=Halomicroarcula sp. GCM10025894 TaxID=3252673 RepID=UPI00360E48B4